MAIARWNPLAELSTLNAAMDQLFDELTGASISPEERLEWPLRQLSVDVVETVAGYELKAYVPGFKPEEVAVTWSEGTLSIEATHAQEKEAQGGRYLRRELTQGNFRRQIVLPPDVIAEHIEADVENGMLKVTIPRATKPEPRRIPVSSAAEATTTPVKKS